MQLKSFLTPFILATLAFSACDKTEKSAASNASVAAEALAAPPGPNQGIEVPLKYNVNFGSPNLKAANPEVQDGRLKLVVQNMLDVHLASDPLELNTINTYIFKGMVKGTDLVSSKPPYAGGIGILSEKMVVEFPTGTFDWTPFESSFTVTKSGPRRITFGIGGWKTGQGTLEVKDLKLYK